MNTQTTKETDIHLILQRTVQKIRYRYIEFFPRQILLIIQSESGKFFSVTFTDSPEMTPHPDVAAKRN